MNKEDKVMSDKKKPAQQSADEKAEVVELDLEDLENVSGGSLKDASSKKTTEISSDTRDKI
jgi:hypothetical protein